MMPSDPIMLFSYLNLKLRDEYPNLDALCDDMDIDKIEILDKMKSAGYKYDQEHNKFS